MVKTVGYGLRLVPIIVLYNCLGCNKNAPTRSEGFSCSADPALRSQRSTELQEISKADQADRSGPPDSLDFTQLGPRDLKRLKRVATIFAEGCFHKAQDYAAAALVFQHGSVSDHYYQTFIWARKAVDLGDAGSTWLAVAGLDRYLLSTGHKQLFATQFGKDDQTGCWCLQQVEESFPEALRLEWAKRGLADSLSLVGPQLNGHRMECAAITYCKRPLKPTPASSVPGFW